MERFRSLILRTLVVRRNLATVPHQPHQLLNEHGLFKTKSLLAEDAGPSSLNSIDLSLSPWSSPEPRRQLISIEIFAFLGLDRAQLCTTVASNGSIGMWRLRSPAQRAVLLGFRSV